MRPVAQLLHNKFVVVLGSSFQRSVYKDLVLILQRDAYLSLSQLKTKGEFSFEQDCLVEGGRLGQMNNGTAYREVRQYRTNHHLIRFYFVTQVFSRYMESILADFEQGIKPDLVVVNSCLWDISRYSREWASEYKENLNKFFRKLKTLLPEESLVVWNMTMPLGKKIVGGFLVPEIQHMGPTLRFDVIEANYFGATLANHFGFNVLDLHFQFRFSLQHRMQDGVHWNSVAHRKITCLLLEHVAQAWGVELPKLDQINADTHPPLRENHSWQTATSSAPARYQGPYSNQRCFYPPVMPATNYNNGPVWTQGQRMRQFNGFSSQYSNDDLPPHSTGYQSFEREAFYRGANNSAAAPYWPVNNLVMKQKRRKPQNRERQHPYRY
ncbi:PC-esterase domain-containing protein 1A isoform X5 [Ctenopharyngodon idella]|uniref:PC-esterase domain-containing protein 1A isoform X4 n=1 Tax=Ctenopharyngodon idella TaxID=7959 RepID=UPI002231772C|nr:PC-esterase domain-containing protein 1A isoform X4 [Ctenopharyngodon idella]XP_051756388.1 PC-esterase domain-containing protein 1A isoform X5 [Ctenopharyngodon idella]